MDFLEDFKTIDDTLRKIVDNDDVESMYIYLEEGGKLNGLEISYIIYKECYNKRNSNEEYSIVSFLFPIDLSKKYPGQISLLYTKDGKKSTIFNLITLINQNFEQSLIDYTSSKRYDNSTKNLHNYFFENIDIANFINFSFTHKNFLGIYNCNVILHWISMIIANNSNLVKEVIDDSDDFYDVFTNDICGFIYTGFLVQYRIQVFTIIGSTIKIFDTLISYMNKDMLNKPNSKGYTPIMKAVESKNSYMFRKFAMMNLDITIKNRNKSVFFYIDKFPIGNFRNLKINRNDILTDLNIYYPDYKSVNL